MHRIRPSLSRGALTAAALFVVLASSAGGILYVPIADLDLARGAELVVEAEVLSERAAASGRQVTEYELAVDRVLLGGPEVSRVVVTSPGRLEADGSGLEVPGAPRFEVGQRAILFLGSARTDGTRPIHQLVLGAFHRVETSDGVFAVRDLTGATEIDLGRGRLANELRVGASDLEEPVRDYDRFADWLGSLGAGSLREPEYLVAVDDLEPESAVRIASRYSFLANPPARWFQFDAGSSVSLRAGASGQEGVPGDVEFDWVRTAIAAWNDDAGSNIRLAYGGTTGAGGGLDRRDSTNTILWNDPNDEVSGSFTCSGGGVLGIGGGWYSESYDFVNGDGATVRGRSLIEADVVINDGAGCYLQRSAGRDGQEILAHEIGHGLGFSHSSVNSALMRQRAHGDGRGADLRPDDEAGARYLYPDFSSGGGGSGGGGSGGGGGGEPGSLRFTSSSASGAEGGTVTLSVQRSGGTAGAASVQYNVVSGSASAGADFTSTSGTLSWGNGAGGTRDVTIQILQDTQVEGAETFEVRLSGASGATLGSPNKATVTIVDDDQAPTDSGSFVFTQSAWSVSESEGGGLDVVVRRNGSSAGAASVDVAVTGGSAQAGADFVGLPIRLSWGAGQGGTRTARLTPVDDAQLEGDETIALALANPSAGASIGATSTAVVTLADDDAPAGAGALRLTSTTYSGLEGGAVEIAVERIGGTQGAVSATVSTAQASAVAGADYRGDSATVRWGAGEAGVKVVRFDLVDDRETEGAEAFGVRLGSPVGGAVVSQPASATAIVRDDDFRVEQEVAAPGNGQNGKLAYQRSGRSAFAWQAADGAGDGVYAQLYLASGAADGASFRLHSSTAGDQRFPAIDFDAAGRLVTVWADEGGSALRADDGRVMVAASTGTRLMARSWSGPGRAVSAAFSLGSDPFDVRSVSVSSDGSGRSWAVWEANGRILARRFDAAGPLGAALDLGDGDLPAIDAAISGESAVVWRRGTELRLRRITAGGTPRPSVVVAESTSLDDPDVALRADGALVVVWSASGIGEDVFYRRYDRDGGALGSAQRASSTSSGSQRRPRVESNAIGDFVVGWEDLGKSGVALRLFDALGAPQGDDLVVTTSLSLAEALRPEVAIAENDEVTVVYDRSEVFGGPAGAALRRIDAQVLDDGCVSGSGRLCTQRGRFEVTALWRDAAGNRGEGTGVELGAETGYFWFFDASNVELVVKALDGCGVNDRFWVFAGGLTDLEVLLLIDDLESGHSQVYYNPPGEGFAPIRDASAFSSCDVALGVEGARVPKVEDGVESPVWPEWPGGASVVPVAADEIRVAKEATCRADEETLCLGGSRFQVRVDWSNASGTGTGRPVGITADTGAFWFFGPDNVEVVVKVLDACALNDKLWVFAGGLTDVGVEMTVIDRTSGRRRTYSSGQGTAFQPIRDVVAFPCS